MIVLTLCGIFFAWYLLLKLGLSCLSWIIGIVFLLLVVALIASYWWLILLIVIVAFIIKCFKK